MFSFFLFISLSLLPQDAFSLLAYSDPWNCPVGQQLDPMQRENICSALNSAILGKAKFHIQYIMSWILWFKNNFHSHKLFFFFYNIFGGSNSQHHKSNTLGSVYVNSLLMNTHCTFSHVHVWVTHALLANVHTLMLSFAPQSLRTCLSSPLWCWL